MSEQLIRLSQQTSHKPLEFAIKPGPDERHAIASKLGILRLRKLTFTGTLTAVGKSDWQLAAKMGATAVQECVATLEPVTTRIDLAVDRRYLEALVVAISDDGEEETEIPDDDTAEALPATLDLVAVMCEALALALPEWPRSAGAPAADISVTEPGQEPLTVETMKPFAGLASLRDKLAKDD
ncbi:MAG: DUF177 domain-containing protein [Rhodobacteraceae bacterium]|nr:DUF177 domain-containing protein [Paracoccaceae bacterium]